MRPVRPHHSGVDQNPLAVAGTRASEEHDIDNAKAPVSDVGAQLQSAVVICRVARRVLGATMWIERYLLGHFHASFRCTERCRTIADGIGSEGSGAGRVSISAAEEQRTVEGTRNCSALRSLPVEVHQP